MPSSGSASSITGWSDTDEYGNPLAGATAGVGGPLGYNWLGANQRATDPTAGLTLMGARLYNSATGQFTSLDPIPGGNTTAYAYPQDPVNMSDTSGLGLCWKCQVVDWTAEGLRKVADRGCALLTAGYLMCLGAAYAVIELARYLAKALWAKEKKFTAALLGRAIASASLAFGEGITGGTLNLATAKAKKKLSRQVKKWSEKTAAVLRETGAERAADIMMQAMNELIRTIMEDY